MNRQEIINKIREIFGVVNTEFSLYKTSEGVELRVDELKMENEVYIITPEGELPAPDGEVVLEDETKLMIKDGKIQKLEVVNEDKVEVVEEVKESLEDDEDKEEEEMEDEDEDKEEEMGYDKKEKKMAEATLVDGTIVEVDGELEVGAEIYVKTEEGRQKAPNGEHETSDGMIVSTEDGVITSIEKKEEMESVEEVKVEEVMETFMEALTSLKEEISTLKTQNEELNNKFSKFSSEPAGEKIYDKKGSYIQERMSARVDKLERLKELRSKK